jgi:hypothetical protein
MQPVYEDTIRSRDKRVAAITTRQARLLISSPSFTSCTTMNCYSRKASTAWMRPLRSEMCMSLSRCRRLVPMPGCLRYCYAHKKARRFRRLKPLTQLVRVTHTVRARVDSFRAHVKGSNTFKDVSLGRALFHPGTLLFRSTS